MQLPERVLTVTGQGSESIPTTLTQVNLAVVVEADTAEAAQQQAAQRQSAVIEWLRSQNVEKLETAGISLNPRYDYIDDRQVLRGYRASNTISFRVPTAAAGDVIDGAVNAGATQINNVSFVAEDSAIESARQRALQSAVQDAQQQADTVLSALGLSRQEVVNVQIGSVSAPPPRPVAVRESQLMSADASTPVVGRSQSIDARVTLYIRY
ncbi:MAG: SIMPL domain-containing protein [Cyanobacteria bacterium J06581_3]